MTDEYDYRDVQAAMRVVGGGSEAKVPNHPGRGSYYTAAVDRDPTKHLDFNCATNPGLSVEYKYHEDVILAELKSYIDATYRQHYVGEDGVQVIDVWEGLGSLETTVRDTSLKYLMRYGKKDGRNRKDLLKALHYIVLLMYTNDKLSPQVTIRENV